MNLVPCTIEHLKKMEEIMVCFVDLENIEQAGNAILSLARTLEHEGEPVACFGMIPMWPGVFQGWALLPEPMLHKYPIAISKAAKSILSDVFFGGDVKRIQTAVVEDLSAGHRWIKWLGFEFEGIAKNYGPGGEDDYFMYARTA